MPQYFDSTASRPMNTKRSIYASGGRVALKKGGNGKWIQKLLLQLRKEELKENVLLLQNQDVQEELKH